MVATTLTPKGDDAREAVDALRGYVYQIYQSALAWIELEPEEILFLEVAEDYAVAASDALKAVQVKETGHNVTINSNDIVTSIDSFVTLQKKNPKLEVRLRHLTTSKIGKEKLAEHRIGDAPTLESWRKLAKTGDLNPLRKILTASKLSKQTKDYICNLDDTKFREKFLKRIHFDCGALGSEYLKRQLQSKLSILVTERGGANSQVDGCLGSILMHLLDKVTQKEDRFVDRNTLEELLEKVTQITINRAQFEEQNQLINEALSLSDPQTSTLVSTRLIEPKPIDEVPFPTAIANRTNQIDSIMTVLGEHGISWIYGAAGVGKTIGAKIAARRIGGRWGSINLRGLNAEQVDAVLYSAIDRLAEQEIDGLLIDDLECLFEPHITDLLLYLFSMCDRTDALLLFTSSRPPSSDFLFSANIPASIGQKIEEFSEQDIREILVGLGVHNDAVWARYIHTVSGGGHPQLAVAAIQSMQNINWNTNELKTLESLLVGNPAIEQVRSRTRERLLSEMSEGSRRLLERLSLKLGSFHRNFVLDMAKIDPAVSDGGIIFDRVIGSWIDQQELDRFALSPLLSNYAANTLTDKEKEKINFDIANSLMKRESLNPIEANSALLAARSGKNTQVIIKLCMAVFGADQNDLEMIAPHLMMFTLMRTDAFAYEDNPGVSQMMRGAQLLLICHEKTRREKVQEALECFETESERVKDETMRTSMVFLVYTKLLLSEPKFGALPNFWDLVRKLDNLQENRDKKLPPELLGAMAVREMNGIPLVGFTFINQARQLKLINELLSAFEFLNSCGQELRERILKPYCNPEFEIDMLVTGAWLAEHNADTIDPPSHSDVFARLEKFAKSWGHTDLAVCCRKYRAIIIDEYGGDKDQALIVLDEGLNLYGETNSEFVRAKAKVLYRAEDHQGSLDLSKALIDGDAPLCKTEKAFLGREAAISAEKQGDYETARHYYLYGSNAARNCNIPDMEPMRVGLMADAALVSWHAGDHKTCLSDLVNVLQELKEIEPKSSLRAAHCHATCRHVLLWLNQDATGEKKFFAEDEETKIYPGIVSNPEPHSEIGERYVTPIEMAWYMLASLENNSYMDVGITRDLATFLPKGPVLEGQLYLTTAKMSKSFSLLDAEFFVSALWETVAELAYFKEQDDPKNSLDIENITYGTFPAPTVELHTDISIHAEQLVLSFISNCIFRNNVEGIDLLIDALEEGKCFIVRKELLSALRGRGGATDYYPSAALLFRYAIDNEGVLAPAQVFELVFKALQIAGQTRTNIIVAKSAFEWLKARLIYIWNHQRFLLRHPTLHEKSIHRALKTEDNSWIVNLVELLQAFLPTIGLSNEGELRNTLKGILKANR